MVLHSERWTFRRDPSKMKRKKKLSYFRPATAPSYALVSSPKWSVTLASQNCYKDQMRSHGQSARPSVGTLQIRIFFFLAVESMGESRLKWCRSGSWRGAAHTLTRG